ncbi:MAG: nucleotide exchange factor GrpE [Alphaproteobacteria bacterium]
MSSKKKPKTESKGKEAPEAAAKAAEMPEAENAPEAAEAAATEQAASGREAEFEAEVADLKDRLLRSMAELENFRRRTEKEREDVMNYAISIFARDMLTVADNLRRALESIPAEARGDDDNLDSLAAGIELTERELLAAFERHGIKKVEALGEMFNHDLHQAMFELEDREKPAGTVVEVMQPGYLLKDRLLRPAMVVLAKGGPRPGARPAPREGAPGEGAPREGAPGGGKEATEPAAGSGEAAPEGSKDGAADGAGNGADERPPPTGGRIDSTG